MAVNTATGTKRKLKTPRLVARKKAKTTHLPLDKLPWKSVSRPREANAGGAFDGILNLEVVSDVEVVYEETDVGKVVKFKIVGEIVEDKSREDGDTEDKIAVVDADKEQGAVAGSSTSAARTASPPQGEVAAEEDEAPFNTQGLLPEWHRFALHTQLARALYAQHFAHPTPIQAEALPLALAGRDVVGIAETGSGKTLAYGLPILDQLLKSASPGEQLTKGRRPVRALVLTPTRELALQVSSHLIACLNPVDLSAVDVKRAELESSLSMLVGGKGKDKGKGKGKEKEAPRKPGGPPTVSVAAIVGGMSAEKQRRMLSRGVDVLVATPGRLWDIIQEDDALAEQLEKLRFLVLDEADRMIETGHFAEMENILRLTLRQAQEDKIEPNVATEEGPTEAATEDTNEGAKDSEMQTFIFSATLSKDLQRNLKKRSRPTRKKGKPASTLDDLLMRLDFRDPTPAVIDIAPEGGLVATLQESKVECLANDKDAYLYYFLLRYPGRTLVFLSAIDGIRRLLPLMALLEIPVFPLHSQLEQRQRLKNLDRFKSAPHGVLLATDVAARGLDVPAVDHVVHYQAPRTADTYVHRNGRTARAARRGFSLMMVAPDERKMVRMLMGSLNRQDEITEMPVELYLLDKLKARVQIARRIDAAQHKVRKERHEKNWLKEAAEAMEIELESDLEAEDSERAPSKAQRKVADAKVAGLKAELRHLLARPLVAQGVSTRYITSGAVPIVDDMLSGNFNETMVGLKKAEAGNDVAAVKKRKTKLKREVKNEEDGAFEEWGGISE